ncbi:hypothetical protein D3C71_1343760 [compost metagenome]
MSWGDSPPRLTVENIYISAFTGSIPPAQYASAHAVENSAYTPHSPFAVSVMRGVSLASFTGPAASALNS